MKRRAAPAVLVLVLAAMAAAACGQRPTTRGSAAVTPPRGTCEGCHASIADEWRASFHRKSFSDETFQSSLALEEPKEHAFCTNCHAPASARAAGVDCAACHGPAPHDAPRARASVATTCAGCHEFAFDDGRPELVQKTFSEHAASSFAGVACADCHMPPREGHRDHRFLAGHAPARIASAVHVDVKRDGRSDAVRVSIRVDAGHAFPTGDMFRRARLALFAEDAGGRIVADAERTFGRRWNQHGPRTQIDDTRIREAWQEVIALDAPDAPITRVRWSLRYERVLAVRGPHVSIASSDTIAEGELVFDGR